MSIEHDTTRRIPRCFMTGRICIHESEIKKRLDEMKRNEGNKEVFVVMPFTPDLTAIYNWQIKPFIERWAAENKFTCEVQRADEVWQVGFIICNKICRQIQRANIVVVDLTFNNANVFYEFGISAGMGKNILPIGMGQLCGGIPERSNFLITHMGIPSTTDAPIRCDLLQYPDFGFMTGDIHKKLYDLTGFPSSVPTGHNVLILYESTHKVRIPNKHAQAIDYDFGKLCNTATATAIRSIFFPMKNGSWDGDNSHQTETIRRYRDKIAANFGVSTAPFDEVKFVGKMVVLKDLATESLDNIVAAVKDAGCVIVDIRHHDPRSFFWLGFLHAIGVDVIPVNSSTNDDDQNSQRTIAFDIAGLWYAELNPAEPVKLQNTLTDILLYFYEKKAKRLQKDAFWTKVFGNDTVSVFLGTVSEAILARNSLGDWDYRSAAEITGLLSQKDYKLILESPIIKPRDPDRSADYVEHLKQTVRGKNCIIIGSSDINELTEVVWATIHGVKPFQNIPDNATTTDKGKNIDCFIATKEYTELTTDDKARLFGYGKKGMASFILSESRVKNATSRGFIYREGHLQQPIIKPFIPPQQADMKKDKELKTFYGQLIVCRNPWSMDKWIVILNGTSGPATLGMAQILTGCLFTEFTIIHVDKDVSKPIIAQWYKQAQQQEQPTINYNDWSEELLAKCLNLLDSNSAGFEALVAVDVYYPSEGTFNDERKVVGWRFEKVEKTRDGLPVDNPRRRNWEAE